MSITGTKNEGSFDPWILLSALKRKALHLGVHYIRYEASSFKQSGNDAKLEILQVLNLFINTNPAYHQDSYFCGQKFSTPPWSLTRIGFLSSLYSASIFCESVKVV